jgi:hypothetical protein
MTKVGCLGSYSTLMVKLLGYFPNRKCRTVKGFKIHSAWDCDDKGELEVLVSVVGLSVFSSFL